MCTEVVVDLVVVDATAATVATLSLRYTTEQVHNGLEKACSQEMRHCCPDIRSTPFQPLVKNFVKKSSGSAFSSLCSAARCATARQSSDRSSSACRTEIATASPAAIRTTAVNVPCEDDKSGQAQHVCSRGEATSATAVRGADDAAPSAAFTHGICITCIPAHTTFYSVSKTPSTTKKPPRSPRRPPAEPEATVRRGTR